MNHYPDHSEFGQYLKQERLARHLSQAEFAEQIGVSEQQVQRWEKGRHFPRPFSYRAIATFLQKTPRLSPIPTDFVHEEQTSTHKDIMYDEDMSESVVEESEHQGNISPLIAALILLAIVIAVVVVLYVHS